MATATVLNAHEYPDDQYYLDPLDTAVCQRKYGATSTMRNDLSKALVAQALKNRVDRVDHDNCDAGEEDAFFVADMGEVYRQHLRWKLHLNRVKPHYGMYIYILTFETCLSVF
jgi:ornithine decarboxylase